MNAPTAFLLAASMLASASPSTAQSNASSATVILLGTGTPVPSPKTQGPATAVVVGRRLFLFDTGPGVIRQMSAARLATDQLESVFVTHLHTDHTLGLADVIFTSWVFGRSTPLRIFGPRGTTLMSQHLIAAYAEDILSRTTGPERAIPNGYRVNAKDISPGIVYASAGVRIRAISIPHNVVIPALAYRIDTPHRSIVISGDTGPSDTLVKWTKNVDVLVHEVADIDGIDGKMPGGADAKTYMRTAHTPIAKLAEIAARANPRLLVLTHIVPTGANEQAMIKAIRAGGFRGRIAFGHDLDRY
jgi:ribonuclease BN (tRNA processing enzyme)